MPVRHFESSVETSKFERCPEIHFLTTFYCHFSNKFYHGCVWQRPVVVFAHRAQNLNIWHLSERGGQESQKAQNQGHKNLHIFDGTKVVVLTKIATTGSRVEVTFIREFIHFEHQRI